MSYYSLTAENLQNWEELMTSLRVGGADDVITCRRMLWIICGIFLPVLQVPHYIHQPRGVQTYYLH